ncbi:MAG: pseudouridine synthase [Clostridium sp.]|jgi:23S rRNA pseudouridine2604 synthase|nr:pseudouridine synthase [Clostridium sp.]
MGIRINKYLAECGVCSRREADKLIEQGKVTWNGRAAAPGDKVCPEDEVTVSGKAVERRKRTVVLAYYKPMGVVCTEKDRHAGQTVKDAVPYPIRLTYAGRLDKDSEGLLLLTNDGDLIHAITSACGCHEKEYLVKVDREITSDFLQRMAAGVFLKELGVTTGACRLERKGKYTFRIVLTQGLNRQIRRMCGEFGYEVRKLCRIRIRNIQLGDMKPGDCREITGEELRQLYQI